MLKANYLIVPILVFLFCSCSKNNANNPLYNATNDSIKKYLDLAKNDTLALNVRDQYNSKAFSLIDLKKNDTVTRYFLSEVTYNNLFCLEYDKYINVSKIYFKKTFQANDTLNLARYFRLKGKYCKNISINDSACYYYIKSEQMYRRTNDVNGLFRVIVNQATLKVLINDLLGAQLVYKRAQKMLTPKISLKNKIELLADMGHCEMELGNYNDGFRCYNELLNLINNQNGVTNEMKVLVYHQIGVAYERIKDYKNAKKSYVKALKISNLNGTKDKKYVEITNAIAYSKMMLKDYKYLPEMFYESLDLAQKSNDIYTIFFNQLDLSKFYNLTGDGIKAKEFAEQALKTARKTKVTYHILNALVQLGKVDKEKAPQCITEYDFKIDSFLTAERKTKNQFLKIQMETDEIAKEKETAIKQKWVYTSIISAVLFIVILLFIIYFQRTKQKELQLLQSQQIANEATYQIMLQQQEKEEQARQKEKKRIALELHDNIMNQLASTRHNLYALTKASEGTTAEQAGYHIHKIRDIENEIRNLSHDLSKDVFSDTNSFVKLVQELINSNQESYDCQFELEIESKINWDGVSSYIKMHLYRIIQEGVHNSNKYAKASLIRLSIIQDETNLCVVIEDNGQGFDTQKNNEGIGLKNMKERIEWLGGKFSIHSQPYKGTRLFLLIPVF